MQQPTQKSQTCEPNTGNKQSGTVRFYIRIHLSQRPLNKQRVTQTKKRQKMLCEPKRYLVSYVTPTGHQFLHVARKHQFQNTMSLLNQFDAVNDPAAMVDESFFRNHTQR